MKDIVFDLGGVLIDWNPRHLYKKIFSTEEEMEWFLANVCHGAWNAKQDAGRPFSVALAGADTATSAGRALVAARSTVLKRMFMIFY